MRNKIRMIGYLFDHSLIVRMRHIDQIGSIALKQAICRKAVMAKRRFVQTRQIHNPLFRIHRSRAPHLCGRHHQIVGQTRKRIQLKPVVRKSLPVMSNKIEMDQLPLKNLFPHCLYTRKRRGKEKSQQKERQNKTGRL